MSTTAANASEVLRTAGSWISKQAGVCGGQACVRNLRLPVWMLVERRRLAMTDAEQLEAAPALTQADLAAAWEYARRRPVEVERALWSNRAGLQDYPAGVPVTVLVRGRQLGFSDEEIREAFDPPALLPQPALDAAWAEYARDPDAVEAAMATELPPELRKA